jgi:hypothetical protein
MSLDSQLRKPLPSGRMVFQSLGEEALLYAEESELVCILNPIARFLWERCDGRTTVAELVGLVHQHFQTEADDTVLEDTMAVLERLVQCGLLTWKEESNHVS